MNRYFTLLLILLCSLTGFSQTVEPFHYPSKLDSMVELKEVVVSYQANKTTPVTFQNLTVCQLSLRPISQEPSFILAETPSITNYSDAGSYQGYSYFRLRGIDQTRVNITLDGIPLNEPEDQGAYLANYPDLLNSLGKIQIQRGVGTTKNGSASYAGSIELFSPNLYDSTYASLDLGYGSFNTAGVTAEFNSGVKNNKALYARATRSYSEGYKYHSSNDSKSLFVSTGLFQEETSWKLNAHVGSHNNGQAWLGVSDSLIMVDRQTNGNTEAEDDDFFQTLAQLQHNWFPTKESSFQSSLYYSHLNGNYNFDLGNYLGIPDIQELYNYAFKSHLLGLYSNYNYELPDFKATVGVHGNLYKRQHNGSEVTYGDLYQNTGYKNEVSFFSKAQSNVGSFTAFVDAQLRYVTFNYEGTTQLDPLSWSFLNPKAGVSYRLKFNQLLYFSVGMTGREPTRNDMFGGNDDLPADSLGNAILVVKDPERVVDCELGYRARYAKGAVGINAYYMNFENEIVLDGKFGPNGLALTNAVDQSIRAGLELTANYKAGAFNFVNNSSYNYSKIQDGDVTFTPTLTPAFIITQEVEYTNSEFTVAVVARYQDRSYINYANTTSLQDYLLINLRLAYKLTPKISITTYINNITNAKYFNNGYEDWDGTNKYFVQAPTNYYFSLTYSL